MTKDYDNRRGSAITKRVGQVCRRRRKIGIKAKRLAEMRDRFLELALLGQGDPKVVVDLRQLGSRAVLEGGIEFLSRLADSAGLSENVSEVIVGTREIRLDA
jgi:hypothetical protein